ncbi:MAG: protein kinase domain-containing protein [Planctomycetota bacterium]
MKPTQCPRCHARIPADGPQGLCPSCLLAASWSEPELIITSGGDSPALPPPPSPEEIQPLFPHLEIVRLLGRGGMGAVYEARQRGLGRVVALKLLWAPAIPDAAFQERFAREGRALAQLSHDNVVAVHDAGKSGPYYWLLMEYVDGPNLRQVLQTGAIEPVRALAIVMQMCAALDYAHEHGVVHRDIKPENVLLTRNGRVKIADFGLAKMLAREPHDVSLTGSLQAMGTLHYVAPEQIERPKEVDHRADIYSLGVVLYEVLTGELPIGRFRLPSRKAQVDARLDDIVTKALQKEPDRRYQAVSDVSTAVGNVVSGRGRSQPRAAREIHRRRASWTLIAGGVAALLVVGVVGAQFGVFGASKPAALSAKEHLEKGRALIGSVATIVDGVGHLDSAYTLDPTLAEIESLSSKSRFEAVDQLLLKGRTQEAVLLARLGQTQFPGDRNDALVQRAESMAAAHVASVVRISSPADGAVIGGRELVLRGDITRSDFDGTLSIDGVILQPIGSRFEHELHDLADGARSVTVLVTDRGGFALPLTRNFVVDTTKPELSVSLVSDEIVPTSFVLRGKVGDSTKTTIKALGREIQRDGSGDWDLALSLEEGRREFDVVATDALGRETKSTVRVIVDATAPVIDSLEIGSEIVVGRATAPAKVRVTDDVRLKSVTWDGKPIEVGAGGMVTLPVRPGGDDGASSRHALEAVDHAGNKAPAEILVRHDVTSPAIEFDAADDEAIVGTTYTVSVKAKDRSSCVLIVNGVEQDPPVDGTFHARVAIPRDRLVGSTYPLNLEVRDDANNKAPGKKTLKLVEACVDCNGSAKCAKCSGTGEVSKGCRGKGCKGGQATGDCDSCNGDGRAACVSCNGLGHGPRETCVLCGGGGRVPCERCTGTGRVPDKCSNPNCENGVHIWNDGIRNRRADCPKCEGGIQQYICRECKGKNNNTVLCGNCVNGQATPKCSAACDNGRVNAPCSSCDGQKKTTGTCTVCLGAGTKLEKCRTCIGEKECKPCGGTGRADKVKSK